METTLLRSMIDHIDSLDPAPYAQDARLCLLDALGCVLYGATLRDGAAVIDGVYGFGAGKVPLPASDKSFTPDACALVMGALCHLRELDDVHVSIIHPGACVVPAAWSAAYFLDQSLDALTAAIFAGYEAAVRISEASGFLAHRERGWHATGTIGPFGAAMAVSRLLGLRAGECVWALGIAGSRTGGTWAFAQDGAMTKRLHPGMAARDGLQAAFLAKAGISGPAYVLEAADGGLFHVMSEGADSSKMTQAGISPAVSSVECKCYASCKSVHSPLEAAAALYRRRREAQLPALPSAVKVYINSSAMHMAGRMYDKGSVTSAQLSIPYGVALALNGYQGSAADYSEEHLADSRLYDLASLVEMEVSADMDLLRREAFTSSAVVEVLWADGSHSREFVKAAKGSIEKPLSVDDKIQKFLSLSAARIGESGAGKLADAILHATGATKVRSLFRRFA